MGKRTVSVVGDPDSRAVVLEYEGDPQGEGKEDARLPSRSGDGSVQEDHGATALRRLSPWKPKSFCPANKRSTTCGDQLAESWIPGLQLVVCSSATQLPAIEDKDHVAMPHRGQPVPDK